MKPNQTAQIAEQRAVNMMEKLKCAVLADMFSQGNASRQRVLADIIRGMARKVEQPTWTLREIDEIRSQLTAFLRAMDNQVVA